MYEAKKTGNQPKLKNFNLNFNFDLQHIHSMQPVTKANMLLFTTKHIDKKIPLFCTVHHQEIMVGRGGVLPHMGYIGKCRGIGYGF